MNDTPILLGDVDLLCEILELVDPAIHVPVQEPAVVRRVAGLLGSEGLLVMAEKSLHLLPRAVESPGRPASELAVQVPGPDGEIAAELLFRRADDRPFGERELVLLALLRPRLVDWLVSMVVGSPRALGESLTLRQVEVLHLVQLGMSNKEIARSLHISAATVRKHLENAYERLGVLSRTAAVSAAFVVGSATEGEATADV